MDIFENANTLIFFKSQSYHIKINRNTVTASKDTLAL